MKKTIIWLAIASKFLIWEPMVANNKFIETINKTKSNSSLIINDNNKKKNYYKKLIYNDNKSSLIIDAVLEWLYTEIVDELKKWWFDSFNEILIILWEKPEFVFEYNVLNTTIRESGWSKELRAINSLIAENKYWDELYDVSNKYTFYLLLNKILDWKDVDNFFLEDWIWKFHDLWKETINLFNDLWITLSKDISKYTNYSFIKNDNWIILCTNSDNEIIELWIITNEQMKNVTQKLVNIIFFIQWNLWEVYSI